MTDRPPVQRWYHLTPVRFVGGLLAVQVSLMLSERFRWFAFNDRKGSAVLIALGLVCLGGLVLLAWFLVSLLLRRRFQFGFRLLLAFMVVISIPLGWLAMEIQRARRQTQAIKWVRQMGGSCGVEDVPAFGKEDDRPQGLERLREPLGPDFTVRVVSVRLKGEKVTDISPLATLRDVRSLTLAETMVSELSPLTAMSRLRSVEICGNSSFNWDRDRWEYKRTPVTDISPLVKNRRLIHLTLDATDVSDITPVAAMTNLRYLDLTDSLISDLSPLAGLESLRSLVLWKSPVSDLAPLAGMTDLEKLDLQETPVADLSPLAGLTHMKWLRLHAASSVTDITPLTRLRNLEHLDLSSTAVSDLSPLAGMWGLVQLDLARTRVTDLSPLAGLTRLKQLNVACLSVDLAPLKGMKDVTIVRGGRGHVIVPKEMEHRILYSTGYHEVEEP